MKHKHRAAPETPDEAVTVNAKGEVFVIPENYGKRKGYSCLGFDVCRERTSRLALWLVWMGSPAVAETKGERGSLESYEYYCELMAAAQHRCLEMNVRCNCELTPQLNGLEGKRVDVLDKYGERRRFIVGKSTGWMPIHLEIHNRRSLGGGSAMGPYQEVRVLR